MSAVVRRHARRALALLVLAGVVVMATYIGYLIEAARPPDWSHSAVYLFSCVVAFGWGLGWAPLFWRLWHRDRPREDA